MKKKLLPLAMLAGLAGAAGTAQAVHLNPDGLGQVLIYPYFTVNGGNDTYISIVNTTNEAKAVKVRFLEGENSQEVLDFNLYLSPFDHWSGAITSNTGDTAVTSEGVVVGGAKLVTGDNSCTAPAIPPAGVPFRPFNYDGSYLPAPQENDGIVRDANTDITRTREGYVEIVEMGVLGFWNGETMVEYPGVGGSFNAAGATKHNAQGVPSNCGTLRAAWNPGPNPAAGPWAVAPARNIEAPTGGLYGYAVVINVAEGTNAAYSAVAVDNFSDAVQNTNPGSLLPTLADSVAFSDVFDAANVISTDFPGDRLDAISSIFMRDTLSNDYVLDPGLAAETDWVVTFPTKRFYVQEENLIDRQPFSDRWNGTLACEHIEVTYWNREEGRPVVDPEVVEIDFSPRPPQLVDIPDGFNLCTEVNIITFNEGSVLGSTDRLTYNLNLAEGFVNGWAQIDFDQSVPPGGNPANYNDREIVGLDVDSGENIFTGLPVVGFAVQKYVNGNVGGLLSNYTGTVEHKFTRDIVNSDL